MQDVIKIKNHHLEFIESKFGADYYLIKMPKTSKYKDYSVQIYSGLMISHDYFYTLKAPWKEEFSFKLIINNREEGKKYRRPTLTWEELKNELNEYNNELDTSELPYALAKVNEYERDKRGISDVEKEYKLGRIDGTWFYLENGERRLLSAKRFKLIKSYLTKEEIKNIAEKLEKLKSLEESLAALNRYNYELTNTLMERLKIAREDVSFNKTCDKFLKEYKKTIKEQLEKKQSIENELENLK